MNEHRKLPKDLTPLNLRAWLGNALDVCGCAEIPPVVWLLVDFLSWASWGPHRYPYDQFNCGVGAFYLIIGRLDRLDLVDHGVSCRCPSLSSEGTRLLKALEETPVDAIDNAGGEAYDGCWYDAG